MAIINSTLDFKNCAKCGRKPIIKCWKGTWTVECKCGLTIPGLKSEEDAQNSWNHHVDRRLAEQAAEEAEAAKKKKRGKKKCEDTQSE